MVRNYQGLINDFLVAYTKNRLEAMASFMSEEITVNFSMLGTATGKTEAQKLLSRQQDFEICTVTTTNYMSYTDDSTQIVAVMAHHLVADEQGPTLFPFLFGGKYVFTIDTLANQITYISFVLEYQAENAFYVKGLWKLSNGYNDYSPLVHFNTAKALHAFNLLSDRHEKLKAKADLFFWCLDVNDYETLKQLTADAFHIVRYRTMAAGKFEGDKNTIQDFIKESHDYYALDQYSVAFRNITVQNGKTVLVGQHLTPHRTGTKKLTVNTKYHSFFDEDVFITFDAEDKIENVDIKKAVDVHYNGFDILCL